MSVNGDDNIAKPDRPSRIAELAHWPAPAPVSTVEEPAAETPAAAPMDEIAFLRHKFTMLLEDFRDTAVLVPLDVYGSLWTADFNGVRWICAFSDEEALARFAYAQGAAEREWEFQEVSGAWLLDVMVPMLPGPGGVALDAGSDEGMLFPPVAGIVPDAVAVDLGGMR